ncbi:MAG: type II toxin-antitoxin system RelE/ParE family toxin [Nanoarchaeota archaeon]
MFNFNLTDELKSIIEKLVKRDKKRVEIINKKIRQIVNSDSTFIEHYKNLKHDLKDFKRVHIDSSFVLVFKVDLPNNFILFVDFDHHDSIYKKKYKI